MIDMRIFAYVYEHDHYARDQGERGMIYVTAPWAECQKSRRPLNTGMARVTERNGAFSQGNGSHRSRETPG